MRKVHLNMFKTWQEEPDKKKTSGVKGFLFVFFIDA